MIRRLFVPVLCTLLLAVTPVLSKGGGGGHGGGQGGSKGSDGGGGIMGSLLPFSDGNKE